MRERLYSQNTHQILHKTLGNKKPLLVTKPHFGVWQVRERKANSNTSHGEKKTQTKRKEKTAQSTKAKRYSTMSTPYIIQRVGELEHAPLCRDKELGSFLLLY